MKDRVIYYDDVENNDFANTNIDTKTIDGRYKYINNNIVWRVVSYILYYIVALPIVLIYTKVKFGTKIVGRDKLKQSCGKYFMYMNHTLVAGDAFHPNIVNLPRKSYIMVGADTVSIKGLQNIVKMLGAVPLPSNLSSGRNFVSAIRDIIDSGHPITIYPEAHIWPYCTFIRPFKKGSFKYPVEMGVDVYAGVTTYQKRKFFGGTKVTIHILGPYRADNTKSTSIAEEELRLKVQSDMQDTIDKYNTYTPIQYIKK